ncbi:unnamed protein product [Ophioblennius macclurei]
MTMTTPLWRIVSAWLCVALVCWYSSCYVGCTEEPQEDPKLVTSPQDDSTATEPIEEPHTFKNEENVVLPAESAESEKPMDDNQHKEETIIQDEANQQHAVTAETQESTSEVELDANKETKAEPSSAGQDHEAAGADDQDHVPLLPPADMISESTDEAKEDSSIPDLPEIIPTSVSGEAPDVAVPQPGSSDLPPSDCEEEETNPYNSDSSPPIVLENTSNVHTAGTKTHADPPLSPPSSQSTPHVENISSHTKKDQDSGSPVTADTDSSASSKDPEDIPTFDEWKRKMMEVEKEKTLTTHTSNNGASHTVKKVQKNFNNYASVECGAKILGANPEAKSTSAILRENMDLYMLNPCSNKIWFVIELCEPIQLKQLDIANFELFSSTPKDFLVSISDRYPTNKWLKLGTFHARDERTVQSFPLDEHLYAKYVKVELVSHFGSEHFCPLSLIRVFGTSMVEEYEEIADPSERTDDPDDDLDYPPGFASEEAKLSNNLIGSATDAIMNMVNNIAVNVLGGGEEEQGNVTSLDVNMTEPSLPVETSDQTTTTDLPSVPETEDVTLSPESDVPATPPPTSENLETETPTAPEDSSEELHPVEDKVVTPLEKEEEEPISPTIILMDKEEELDEEKEKTEHDKRQQESLDYCAAGPSLSSSCSCAASLYEYLQKRCSACLSKRRRCQTMEAKQILPTPSWQLPSPPSSCPDPQQHRGETPEPREEEQAPDPKPESGAIAPEAPRPQGNASLSASHPLLLEPSQTSKLPKQPSLADSSSARATPIVRTPQLSSEPQAKEPEPSRDAPAQEKQAEPSASLGTTVEAKPTVGTAASDVSAGPTEEKTIIEATPRETIEAPTQTQDGTDQLLPLLPTVSPQLEKDADPPAVLESSASTDISSSFQDAIAELDLSGGPAAVTEGKTEDLTEDGNQLLHPSAPTPTSSASPSLSDIYAEPPNDTEQNGNAVHGSSQKESVFMRLNNRIKALEMNMSLSGRYLEQLSQRYRKQMEEMQKAFNKTIIKLQNTSRLAEEQDQRQTESIQMLQGQLENMTQLVLNLSVRVSQLQTEVSDRQNYLLLSLLLCLSLGLLLCAHHCRISTVSPTTEPEPPIPKSYTYCCPDSRQLSSCEEKGLKRSASYPLIHSESLQLAGPDGPDVLHPEETQSLCPGNRKRRRRNKIKPPEKVETLKPSIHSAPELCNGAALCNGAPVVTNATLLPKRLLLQPTFRDWPSEGSSEGSSHSDDPSFCGITTACSRLCDGLPPPKTRAEKRALRRRRPKPSCAVVDLLHAPRRDNGEPLAISTIHDIMNRKMEPGPGTFVALSGPV